MRENIPAGNGFPYTVRPCPDGGTGRRAGLKILFPLKECRFDSDSGHHRYNTPMNFCSHCGKPLTRKVPPGDHLPRFVCTHCGAIHYQNPKLVVGCVPEWEGKVLLCRRAIDPRKGYWTLPAGFMENGETVEQAAARESREEALADVEILPPLALVSVPHINQVHLMFRAKLRGGRHGVGAETSETALLAESEIPWPEIAFPSVHYTLERFFADRRAGHFGFHTSVWEKPRER